MSCRAEAVGGKVGLMRGSLVVSKRAETLIEWRSKSLLSAETGNEYDKYTTPKGNYGTCEPMHTFLE